MALPSNRALESLSLFGLYMDDLACEGICSALATNVALRSLSMDIDWNPDSCNCFSKTQLALETALATNGSLICFNVNPPMYGWTAVITDALTRNVQLTACWWHLALISVKSSSASVRSVVDSMTSRGFCYAVFRFLMPTGPCCAN